MTVRFGATPMQLGINLSTWTARPRPEEHGRLLADLKRWGYDVCELHVAAMTDAEAARWVDLADDAGMALVANLVMPAAKADPASPDESLRNAAADALRRAIDQAAVMRSPLLVGPMLQGLGRFTGAAPSDAELDRVAAVLRRAADHAAASGIGLAVEPLNRFEMYIANTLEQAAAILDRIARPNVAILADTHHANIEQRDPVGDIVAHLPRIGYIHISENDRSIPGTGHAAPPRLFAALRRAGYDGHLTVEAFTNRHADLNRRLHLWRAAFTGDEAHLAESAARYLGGCWADAEVAGTDDEI